MPSRSRRLWTPEDVLAAIRARADAGLPLNYQAVVADDEALTGAARKRYGSWSAALAAAGLDPVAIKRAARQAGVANSHPMGYWTEERVIASIQEHARAGHDLSAHRLQQIDPSLVASGQRLFGGWDRALRAAGYAPDLVRRAGAWTDEAILDRIRQLARAGADLADNSAQAWDASLYGAAQVHYGSWQAALDAAGIDEHRRTARWSRARVIEAIREGRDDRGLRKAAVRYYGSMAAARLIAGVEPGDADDLPTPNRLYALRRATGLSQTELGRRAGCSHRWIGLIETGRAEPTLRQALRIARALNVTVEQIWGNDGDANPAREDGPESGRNEAGDR